MSTRIQKIDYAIYHDPTLIPILLKDCSIKNGLIYSRLRRAVPRRVGIEFECLGNPASTYKYGWNGSINHSSQLKEEFHLTDYSQDLGIARSESEYNKEFRELNTVKCKGVSFNELRVSISDYRQLSGLANILKLFDDSCKKPIGGGIHIHVDFNKYQDHRTREIVQKYITRHLSEVEEIFPRYDGTYNKRKVGNHQKGTYVNLSYHGTIEFRIAPLTFDYSELIKWVVGCNKFVTKVIHECHLLTDEELESRKPIVNEVEVPRSRSHREVGNRVINDYLQHLSFDGLTAEALNDIIEHYRETLGILSHERDNHADELNRLDREIRSIRRSAEDALNEQENRLVNQLATDDDGLGDTMLDPGTRGDNNYRTYDVYWNDLAVNSIDYDSNSGYYYSNRRF